MRSPSPASRHSARQDAVSTASEPGRAAPASLAPPAAGGERLASSFENPRRRDGRPSSLPPLRTDVQRTATVAPRASPILANARKLLPDTAALIDGVVEITPHNLIATTYGTTPDSVPRTHEQKVRAIADNLILDVNLAFEAELQRALEHEPHFLRAAKEMTGLIHTQLKFKSLENATNADGSLTSEAKAERKSYIQNRLAEYFPREVLDDFFRNPRRFEDEHVDALLRDLRDDRSLMTAEKQEVVGLVKLVKLLDTQLPYFGGSVEYEHHIDHSPEFWLYHLSTLVKDPQRQYPMSDPALGVLPKPLIDYTTDARGMLPYMNQFNLGLGIAEASWDKLPPRLQTLIEQRLSDFEDHVRRDGDHVVPASAATLHRARNKAERLMAGESSGSLKVPPRFQKVPIGQLWDAANEDERKAIYSDMCRIPWSDAHLLEGGPGFEQTYVRNPADIAYRNRLPSARLSERESGLMNVAGIHANILQTPAAAADVYESKGLGRVQPSLDQLQVRLGRSLPFADLRADFETKHGDWHASAMAHHKPIQGGMSGHTLGYLNLYGEALGQVDPAERHRYPSMETARAVLLVGLIGNKRHHSYDEIMAASTAAALAPEELRLKYEGQQGYADVFEAKDPHIVAAAHAARHNVRQKYFDYAGNTVYALLTRHEPERAEALRPVLDHYIAAMDWPAGLDRAKARIVDAVGPLVDGGEPESAGADEAPGASGPAAADPVLAPPEAPAPAAGLSTSAASLGLSVASGAATGVALARSTLGGASPGETWGELAAGAAAAVWPVLSSTVDYLRADPGAAGRFRPAALHAALFAGGAIGGFGAGVLASRIDPTARLGAGVAMLVGGAGASAGVATASRSTASRREAEDLELAPLPPAAPPAA